eukprot:13033040-Alexandrium_andersonii.AAC.2
MALFDAQRGIFGKSTLALRTAPAIQDWADGIPWPPPLPAPSPARALALYNQLRDQVRALGFAACALSFPEASVRDLLSSPTPGEHAERGADKLVGGPSRPCPSQGTKTQRPKTAARLRRLRSAPFWRRWGAPGSPAPPPSLQPGVGGCAGAVAR